jgi:hypothetical protein
LSTADTAQPGSIRAEPASRPGDLRSPACHPVPGHYRRVGSVRIVPTRLEPGRTGAGEDPGQTLSSEGFYSSCEALDIIGGPSPLVNRRPVRVRSVRSALAGSPRSRLDELMPLRRSRSILSQADVRPGETGPCGHRAVRLGLRDKHLRVQPRVPRASRAIVSKSFSTPSPVSALVSR